MDKRTQLVLFGDAFSIPILIKSLKRMSNTRISHIVYVYPLSLSNLVSSSSISSASLFQISNKKDWERLNQLISENSLGICFSFSRKIPSEVLCNFSFGAINLHGGKLPEFAGPNALNWSIIKNERELILTAHLMTENIDEGKIIAEVPVKIEFWDDALSLREKIGMAAENLLPGLVKFLLHNSSLSNQINVRKVHSYLPKRNPEDGMFDWNWNNLEIYNMIRALVKPWPGARYLNTKGEIVVIDKMMSLDEIEALRIKEGQNNR